jgi:pimeloyl-ACP methyl ester carboxylesterase
VRQPIVDTGGANPPLILVPGVQGHWEWMRPAIAALALRFRVISFSLAGERRSTRRMDHRATFAHLVDQLDDVIESCGARKPVVCGVSYGGLVALHYAARHRDRVAGLILVSTPSPRWRPNARLARYRRYPRVFAPLFALQSLGRVLEELRATFPSPKARLRFLASYLAIIARTPLSPSRASRRLSLIEPIDFAADCRALTMPVLIVTGEQSLDTVVPVDDTLEYRSLIAHAVVKTIERTGHLGSLTRPDMFAAIVSDFHRGLPRRPS